MNNILLRDPYKSESLGKRQHWLPLSAALSLAYALPAINIGHKQRTSSFWYWLKVSLVTKSTWTCIYIFICRRRRSKSAPVRLFWCHLSTREIDSVNYGRLCCPLTCKSDCYLIKKYRTYTIDLLRVVLLISPPSYIIWYDRFSTVILDTCARLYIISHRHGRWNGIIDQQDRTKNMV